MSSFLIFCILFTILFILVNKIFEWGIDINDDNQCFLWWTNLKTKQRKFKQLW